MPYIELTQGKRTRVDAKDFKWLNQFKWCAVRGIHTWYARRNIYTPELHAIWMHREILGLRHKDGKYTDHINHDGLDNRQNNLRICTHSTNMMNCADHKNSSSKFKGVNWHVPRQKWLARIMRNGKAHHLGLFEFERDAALAYNRAAIEYFGSFACLNII